MTFHVFYCTSTITSDAELAAILVVNVFMGTWVLSTEASSRLQGSCSVRVLLQLVVFCSVHVVLLLFVFGLGA